MKKRFGFTLAEVLITLGIIGVVAALAAPALNSAVQKSKVGPSLRKFMSTVQVANESVLSENNSDSITSMTDKDVDAYLDLLSKHVKGAKENKIIDGANLFKNYSGNDTIVRDGETNPNLRVYTLASGGEFAVEEFTDPTDSRNVEGAYKGKIARLYYDLDGFEKKPYRLGKDVFVFLLDDSGTVIPQGGKMEYSAYSSQTIEQAWKDSNECSDGATPTVGLNCAGSIADNDWKVIYKY